MNHLGFALWLGWMIYFVIIQVRLHFVIKYRRRLLKQVSWLAALDVRHGRPWLWRYEAFDSVGFNTQVWRFWRRLDSFYKDKSFLHPAVERAS